VGFRPYAAAVVVVIIVVVHKVWGLPFLSLFIREVFAAAAAAAAAAGLLSWCQISFSELSLGQISSSSWRSKAVAAGGLNVGQFHT
jgi:hypothetical protein